MLNSKRIKFLIVILAGVMSFTAAAYESCKGQIIVSSKEVGDVVLTNIGAGAEDISGSFESGPSPKTLHAAAMKQIFKCIKKAVKSTKKPKACGKTVKKKNSHKVSKFFGYKRYGKDIQNLGDVAIKAMCTAANELGHSKITNFKIKYKPVNKEDKCNKKDTFYTKKSYNCGKEGGISASESNKKEGRKQRVTGKYLKNAEYVKKRVKKYCAKNYNMSFTILGYKVESDTGKLSADYKCK